MNIIQSFWTKPAIEKRWNISNQLEVNVWLCAASCLLAQQNGARVTIYTDKLGAELLQDIPYDEVKISLDEPLKNCPRFFWAAGKFVALADAPLGSVHIDNDVLLMERKTVRALDFSNADVIVQQEENVTSTDTRKFYRPHRRAVKYLGFPRRMKPDYPKAYNVGVIGFNNEELRDIYVKNYFDTLNYLSSEEKQPKIEELNKDSNLSLDLIYEQVFIAQLTDETCSRVKFLLDKNNIARDVERLNYRHLLGSVKYKMLPKIQALVRDLDPDLYNILI